MTQNNNGSAAESIRLGANYQVNTPLGGGVLGATWRGTGAGGADLTFTVLSKRFASNPQVVRHLLAQRPVLGTVRGPNVVPVIDMVADSDVVAVVSPHVKGTDLGSYLHEQGTIAPAEACRLVSQTAKGLTSLHSKGLTHRDVKPSNILIDTTRTPAVAKITDYAIPSVVEEWAGTGHAAVLASTPEYLSPEVIGGEPATVQSDLYALGVVLYEALCGVTPFAPLEPEGTMQAILTLDAGRPAGVDDALWEVLSMLLSRDPRQRGTADSLSWRLSELENTLDGVPKLAKLDYSPAPSPLPQVMAFPGERPRTAPVPVTPAPTPAPQAAPQPTQASMGDAAPQAVHNGLDQRTASEQHASSDYAGAAGAGAGLAAAGAGVGLDALMPHSAAVGADGAADVQHVAAPDARNQAGEELAGVSAGDAQGTGRHGAGSHDAGTHGADAGGTGASASTMDAAATSAGSSDSDLAAEGSAHGVTARNTGEPERATESDGDDLSIRSKARRRFIFGVIGAIVVGLLAGAAIALAVVRLNSDSSEPEPTTTSAATPTEAPSSAATTATTPEIWPPEGNAVICTTGGTMAVRRGTTYCTFGTQVQQALTANPSLTTTTLTNSQTRASVNVTCTAGATITTCRGSDSSVVWVRK